MKIIILFAAMFISAAQAEVRHHHTDVKLCPNLVFDNAEQIIAFQGWHGVIPQPEQSEDPVTIQSDWSYLTCQLKNDELLIAVSIPEEAYPIEEVPVTATCAATDSLGHTQLLHVHPVLLDSSDKACWPRSEGWYSQPTLIYSDPDSGGVVSLPLLSGHSFIDGTYPAKLSNGTAWAGVSCQVTRGGEQMTMQYSPTTPAGTGDCLIPDGTGTLKVPIELDRSS